MKIISLSSNIAGHACAVACIIKKDYYNNNCETNFFDYLEISFLSIIQLLSLDNLIIDNLLSSKNIKPNKDNKNTLLFDYFDKVYSHHDLILNYNDNDYNNVIQKYHRRYNRFIETIKNQDKIFFVRFGLEKEEEVILFFNIMKNINPTLNIYLINPYYDDSNYDNFYSSKLINNYNFYPINFKNYMPGNNIFKNEDIFLKTFEYKWEIVFKIINQII